MEAGIISLQLEPCYHITEGATITTFVAQTQPLLYIFTDPGAGSCREEGNRFSLFSYPIS